jgi:tetratricopeptide (TPR) repeat protein
MPAYERAVRLGRKGKWPEQERLWRELVAADPDSPTFHFNLGVSLYNQKRMADAEACIRRAVDLEPDYLFASATLALIRMDAGSLDEARQILDEIVVPDPVNPDALATYLMAQTQVAMAERKPQVAVGWLGMAKEVAPDNPQVRQLASRLKIVTALESLVAKVRDFHLEKAAATRQRVVARTAPLEECLAAYTKQTMAAMASAVGLGVNPNRVRKADLLRALCAALRTPDVCGRVVRNLADRDRAALSDLLATGGRQDYAAFVRRYPVADDEYKYEWTPADTASPLTHLKRRGLVVEATVDRVESVFIPAELPLDPAWLTPPPAGAPESPVGKGTC